MSPRFRPAILPTLAAIVMVALTVYLGNWQSGRALEKEVLRSQLQAREAMPPLDAFDAAPSADALVYRRLVMRGTYDASRQIFLDNKDHKGRVGMHVLTPLLLEKDQRMLLVNRGWVARPRDYPAVPTVAAPAGIVEVRGLAVTPPRRFVELSKETVQGALWQNLTIERAAAHFKVPVLPVVLLADPAAQGLERVIETPDTGIDKHRGYSLQWYSLAGLIVLLWLGLNFRRTPS